MADETTVDEVVELDLPEEIRQSFEQELGVEPEKTEEKPAEKVEAPPPEKAAVKPAEAVTEREKVEKPAPPTHFTTAEDLRARWDAEQARLRATQTEDERKKRPARDYNTASDWNQAASWLKEDLKGEYERELAQVRAEALRVRCDISEQRFVETHPDFYDKVKQAGVLDLISTKNGAEAPRDPFLHSYIYAQADPAKALYEYALGRLGTTVTAEAETRGEARGKREVITAIEKNAARPTSIAKLPSSSGKAQLRIGDIARLSDEKKLWIKKNRPDVWNQYLGKPA